MGLDTTHGAWNGPYSSFNGWRRRIAALAGYPPLDLMEGYYYVGREKYDPFIYISSNENLEKLKKTLPIKWKSLKIGGLTTLLRHSDCEGSISYKTCNKIANELEELLPLLDADYDQYNLEKTMNFIKGCRLAYSKKEKLDFH